MELTLSQDEFYAVIKLMFAGAESMPHVIEKHKDALDRLVKFYMDSPSQSQFVITTKDRLDGNEVPLREAVEQVDLAVKRLIANARPYQEPK